MADFSEDQVDLCLGAMVQDVAEDNISPSEVESMVDRRLLPVLLLSRLPFDRSAAC